MEKLIKVLLDGDQYQSIAEAGRLRDAGFSNEQIVTEGIEEALDRLDAKCTVEQFNLLEIMLCGRAVMGIMRELYPSQDLQPETKATVVIGTLEGDVHDLGKNIFKIVLTAKGYRVVDCGKDCPLDRLVSTAGQEDPLVVGVSGLLTSVIPQVCQLRDRMKERGLGHVKVIAGGASLKQASPGSLEVDFVAQHAFDGLRYLEKTWQGVKTDE